MIDVEGDTASHYSEQLHCYNNTLIVAVPGYYNEFLFCREANVIRRYLRRTTFVPSKFLLKNFEGTGWVA